jgi:hypothetical protein
MHALAAATAHTPPAQLTHAGLGCCLQAVLTSTSQHLAQWVACRHAMHPRHMMRCRLHP